jgi:hypothetical protein
MPPGRHASSGRRASASSSSTLTASRGERGHRPAAAAALGHACMEKLPRTAQAWACGSSQLSAMDCGRLGACVRALLRREKLRYGVLARDDLVRPTFPSPPPYPPRWITIAGPGSIDLQVSNGSQVPSAAAARLWGQQGGEEGARSREGLRSRRRFVLCSGRQEGHQHLCGRGGPGQEPAAGVKHNCTTRKQHAHCLQAGPCPCRMHACISCASCAPNAGPLGSGGRSCRLCLLLLLLGCALCGLCGGEAQALHPDL